MKTADEKQKVAKKLVQLIVEALVEECECVALNRPTGEGADAGLSAQYRVTNKAIQEAVRKKTVGTDYEIRFSPQSVNCSVNDGRWYVDEETGGFLVISNFSHWGNRLMLVSVDCSGLPIKEICQRDKNTAGAG